MQVKRITPANLMLVYLVFLGLASVPLWTVTYPPLQDYPNHIARMHIILNGDQTPFREFYEVRWAVLPNLAMDAIVPAIAQIFPLALSGKIFIGIIFFLLTSSAFALHYALYREISIVPLIGFLFLYNWAFHAGFLNFLFGTGLALWAVAIWILLANQQILVRIGTGLVLAVTLFFAHLYAVALYALIIGTHEIVSSIRGAGFTPLRLAQRCLIVGLPLILPIVLFFLFSPTSGESPGLDFNPFISKLAVAGYLFDRHNGILDKLSAGLILFLIVFVVAGRRLPVSIEFGVVLIVAGTVYLAMPSNLLGVANVDWRMLVPLAFLGAGALRDCFWEWRGPLALTVTIGLLVSLRVSSVVEYWKDGERAFVNVSRVLDAMPVGARLAPVDIFAQYQDSIYPTPLLHYPSFAVIEKAAFVPTMFAIGSQQLLRFRGDYTGIAAGHGPLYRNSADDLDCSFMKQNFDYLIVVSASDAKPCLASGFTSIARKGRFSLYRIQGGDK